MKFLIDIRLLISSFNLIRLIRLKIKGSNSATMVKKQHVEMPAIVDRHAELVSAPPPIGGS
jgi:hypothetical protein